jgi:hypothetical protein
MLHFHAVYKVVDAVFHVVGQLSQQPKKKQRRHNNRRRSKAMEEKKGAAEKDGKNDQDTAATKANDTSVQAMGHGNHARFGPTLATTARPGRTEIESSRSLR